MVIVRIALKRQSNYFAHNSHRGLRGLEDYYEDYIQKKPSRKTRLLLVRRRSISFLYLLGIRLPTDEKLCIIDVNEKTPIYEWPLLPRF